MHLTSILIASTLISCNISTGKELKELENVESKEEELKKREIVESNEEELKNVESNEEELKNVKSNEEELKKLKELEEIYKTIPMNEKERVSFAKSIDSIIENVPLEDLEVFNKFAPFLLHSVNHNEKLKDMDLRQVYESKNENLKNDWINHANKKVGSLRFSFNIVEINNDDLLKEKIEFCNNFSKLTNVQLLYKRADAFDKSKTWSNSMEVLSNLKEISACTELELLGFDSDMLKYFIDGAAASKLKVLQQLKKLKIIFNSVEGIRYINSAVENFPSLVTSLLYLPNLSEITIENQAIIYIPNNASKSDNLVNLIEKLPKNITIKLIGRFIESNEGPEYVNALEEDQNFVNALKKRSHTVNVSILYKLYSFDKKNALRLRDTMKDSKLAITILDTRNGIERKIPISIAFLDNLLKAEYFHFGFTSDVITVVHRSMKDFLSSFGTFLKGCKSVIYTDKKPRTEIWELLSFVKAFNKCEDLVFRSNFLELSNEYALDSIISEINKRDKGLILDALAILIDSENLIPFYNKIKVNEHFKLKADSWLIRVRNGNIDAFIQILPSIYKTLYPEGGDREEFLEKIEALSELDAFIIDLSNKDVLYIDDKEFDHVLKVLKTIKYRFEKVFIAEEAFTEDELNQIRDKLEIWSSCRLEILTKESLLNPWLPSQSITNENYLISLFLWLKTIFRYYS
ncbi:hypothetical protein GINT2_001616 [Glugoides intestinalis]